MKPLFLTWIYLMAEHMLYALKHFYISIHLHARNRYFKFYTKDCVKNEETDFYPDEDWHMLSQNRKR